MANKPSKLKPQFNKPEIQLIYWGLRDLQTTEVERVKRLTAKLVKLGAKPDLTSAAPKTPLLPSGILMELRKTAKDAVENGESAEAESIYALGLLKQFGLEETD